MVIVIALKPCAEERVRTIMRLLGAFKKSNQTYSATLQRHKIDINLQRCQLEIQKRKRFKMCPIGQNVKQELESRMQILKNFN